MNYENPIQEKAIFATGVNAQVVSEDKFKTVGCPYCYDGTIVNSRQEGTLKCSKCHKAVIVEEVN